MKLYVGNLDYSTSSDDLEKLFAAYGRVEVVQLIKDRDTGQSKGFCFVEMGHHRDALAAMTALNGKNIGNRSLIVNEAKPQEGRGKRGGGYRR
jgi:cold-inducible RNA-binding protein